MKPIVFFVPGMPRSTQSGTVMKFGRRLMPVRRGTSWSSICGLIARQHAPRRPLDGPIAVDMLVCFPNPKSKRSRYPGRVDVENACKGVLDALEGVIYVSDRQICDLVERKRFALTPGVRISVQPMPDDWDPEYRP